jgi:hypothetical protein
MVASSIEKGITIFRTEVIYFEINICPGCRDNYELLRYVELT